MALLSIIFGRLPGLQQKTIGILPVDVFTEEAITFTAQTTDHPIETGALVTDHIRNDPVGLRVRGTVRAELRGLAFNVLQTLHKRREPVFIVTGLQTFRQMAITRLEVPREARTASSFVFSAEFRQVVYAASVTGQLVQAVQNARDTASATATTGSGTPSPASAPQAAAVSQAAEATGGPQGSLLSRLVR